MRIIYVEDNLANVHLVKRVARMGKHEVINYIDGMDALNNFASDKPDLVLMDIQLAGELTGIEVVQKLRNDGFTTPIIAVTAYAMVGDKERCIEAGCTGYMSKPIPVSDLVHLFNEYDQPQEEAVEDATAQHDKPETVVTAETTEKKTVVQTSKTPEKPAESTTPTENTEKTPVTTEASDTTEKPTTSKVPDTAEKPTTTESEPKKEDEDKTVADAKPDAPLHKQPTQPSFSRTEAKSFASESEDKTSATKPTQQPITNSDGSDNLKKNDETKTSTEDSLSTQHTADDKHAKMQ
jgi:two-component system cell cycle response regulator DivK